MRIIPILTALFVVAFLYILVFERPSLLNFAQTSSPVAADAPTAEDAGVVAATEVVAEDAADDSHIVRVVAMASVATNIDSAVILRGRTEAAREVSVAAETSGLVVSEPIDKGNYVDAGDLLCELDPGTRAASLAEARARLAEARGRVPEAEAAIAEADARVREMGLNVVNARRLNERGISSETQLINAEAMAEAALAGLQRAQSGTVSAEAGIEAAQASVAAAEAEIDRLQITAPFGGLLETSTAELGSLVDKSKVRLGALAGAKLTSGENVSGEVTFVSRSADETTRTFRVEVEVANTDLSISAGQTVEIVVASDGRQAHLVPQSALTLDDDGVLGVRTVAPDSTAMFMPVTLLRDTAEGVWLTDLPETVNIITVGQEYVIDGVTVAPTYQEAEG